nr:RHS repeat-associated core domain-containing protein [Arenimonas oryziterrae]
MQEYRYDGLGRRVQARDVVPDQTTYWIYSQAGQVLYSAEARRSQNIYYIYLGNTQVATRAVAWGSGTETIRYQHTDSLGSPVAETDPSRSVTERKSYAPYGEAYNSIIDGTGYAGHVMDQGTGLTYMQQRYYDPQIGRFLSEDPMDPDANTGASFDRYTYALNNPYRFLDPDGRQAKEGDQPKPESDGERRAREKAQRDRVLHSDGVPSAADFAASHPLPQGLVDASNGLGTGIINGASFGFADGEYFFDKAETPEYLALRDSGTVLGTGAGGGAFAKAGAAGGRQVLGKMVTSPTFGPAGTVFGRSRLGGSSLFNINANNTLRIGWGWKGAAQTGTHVFRIAGKVVEKIKQSGHIDLWP